MTRATVVVVVVVVEVVVVVVFDVEGIPRGDPGDNPVRAPDQAKGCFYLGKTCVFDVEGIPRGDPRDTPR